VLDRGFSEWYRFTKIADIASLALVDPRTESGPEPFTFARFTGQGVGCNKCDDWFLQKGDRSTDFFVALLSKCRGDSIAR